MNRLVLMSIFLPIMFLSACSSYVRPLNALPEHEGEGNNVTILREYNFFGSGVRYWPVVDEEVSGLFPKEYVSFALSSGKHSIGVNCHNAEDSIDVDIKDNEQRYFIISFDYLVLVNPMDIFGKRCAKIEEVPKTEALELLAKSTRIKTGYVSDCHRQSVVFENSPNICFTYVLP